MKSILYDDYTNFVTFEAIDRFVAIVGCSHQVQLHIYFTIPELLPLFNQVVNNVVEIWSVHLLM